MGEMDIDPICRPMEIKIGEKEHEMERRGRGGYFFFCIVKADLIAIRVGQKVKRQ